MRPNVIIGLTLSLAAALPATAASLRTLSYSHPSQGVRAVVLEAGVGDIEFRATDTGDIRAEVEITAKGGSWFGGVSEKEIDALTIKAELRGDTLYLALGNAPSHDRKFGEDWSIQLPRPLAASVKVGVGEVRVLDVAGDVSVKAGVGDIRIEGEQASFGSIHAEAGVGDVELRTPEGHREAEGFIGHSLSANGSGKSLIEAKAGVGDITIRLR
ncbi:MAG: hypothetical protein ACM3O7_07025 [Acidobacteriota bacterium]